MHIIHASLLSIVNTQSNVFHVISMTLNYRRTKARKNILVLYNSCFLLFNVSFVVALDVIEVLVLITCDKSIAQGRKAH